MALASLRYGSNKALDETRLGFVIYGGQPGKFHEWQFRAELKMAAVVDDEKKRR